MSQSFAAALVAVSLGASVTAAAAATPELQEVTVTAQRVEENLQTTPVSMTALSGEFLDKFDVARVTSLDMVTPNLIFNSGTGGSSAQVSAFIRGVGQFDFLLTTDPAVGLYVDGVYLARTFGTNLELTDIQRVEVLRGPQGTLFGKNNIGGAINITTLTPTGSGRDRLPRLGRQLRLLRARCLHRPAARGQPGARHLAHGTQVRRLAGSPAGRERRQGGARGGSRDPRLDARATRFSSTPVRGIQRADAAEQPERHDQVRPGAGDGAVSGALQRLRGSLLHAADQHRRQRRRRPAGAR